MCGIVPRIIPKFFGGSNDHITCVNKGSQYSPEKLSSTVPLRPLVFLHIHRYADVAQMESDGRDKNLPLAELGQEHSESIAPLNTATSLDTRVDPSQFEISARARDLTSQVLEFLSTASNETLGACVVGLGATTYFILGRVGLILIGIVGGVVLHATWEDSGSNEQSEGNKAREARKRREKGLDIVQRVLDMKNVNDGGRSAKDKEICETPLPKTFDFSGFPKDTKSALDGFTNAIVRDYVYWWYKPILPDDASFPSACRQTLNRFLLSVSSHLSRKRPADAFLDFLTNSSSIVIVFLSELSGALAASRGEEPQDAISNYLEDNPGGSLANVLDAQQQKRKLAAVAQDILQTFLDAKAFGCDPVRTFLQQIFANLVLDLTVTSCSRAYFINEWIIFALEEGDTTQLVQAIDAGVSNATSNGAVKGAAASASKITTGDVSGSEERRADNPQFQAEHKRTVSRAEEAMEAAMQEAQKMNEMIAAEEARRSGTTEPPPTKLLPNDEAATSPTNGLTDHIVSSPTSTTPNGDIARSATPPTAASGGSTFKSFDQILATQQPTALRSDSSPLQTSPSPQLTLHNATISIFDDSVPGEKGNIRSKPTVEYLLQIEPPTSQFPGWMIARKYPDFETLHEVLKRIAVISGVAAFAEKHPTLPGWKSKTKASLRLELEKYLQDALSYQRLAECEGMKRFLDKDQHLGKSSPGPKQGGFGFPTPAAFETMGKGMLDALSSAPKGAATGGKAIVGGVTGVFGGVGALGQKKQSFKPTNERSEVSPSTTTTDLPRASLSQACQEPRASMDVNEYAPDTPRESLQLTDQALDNGFDAHPSVPREDFDLEPQRGCPCHERSLSVIQ